MDREVIDISSEEEGKPEEELSRRDILSPFIHSVVSALGSLQSTPNGRVYEMGDSCLSCLKDLKKFWRKDDNDDERTVARIFFETRVLANDLIPILMETAGKGAVSDKRAIACADLITAMTWPIDIAEELQELDEELDAGTDYTTLIHAQLTYKAAVLQPGVLKALLAILAPPLAKTKRERTERDAQIINVILHAFRNLAFIKDLPANAFASSDQAEFSSLQSKMIVIMKQTGIMELFLTLAANAMDPMFNPYNVVLLEIFSLLYRGVKPQTLTLDAKTQPREQLRGLLEIEAKSRRDELRQRASRHSRFGTTVAVKSGKDLFVLHKQNSLTADPSTIMDSNKKKVNKRIKKQDELASFESMSVEAMSALQKTAIGFLQSCFEAFFSSLLKDIQAERPKITETDNIRLLVVVKWFLEFFLALRAKETEGNGGNMIEYEDLRWRFEMVAEVVERSWIGWVLKRMRLAMDDKPKQWTELRAGMDCLSQLLYLLEQMSLPTSPDVAHEVSKTLQHQLYYNGEILEIAFESLRGYKEQSVAYLDSSIHLAFVLLRMLERWAKTQGEMYVRKRSKSKRKSVKVGEEDGIVDVPSDEDTEPLMVNAAMSEHMFTFEKFESRFAHEDITRACLAYLERYKDFDSNEKMRRVVGLLHRQAVKAKAEGLFFKVTTLDLFNRILAESKSLPRDSAYKDLVQLIQYILRKFFKSVVESPMLIIEAFFPKNRGQWKQFSSFEPDVQQSISRPEKVKKALADVQVKKGWSKEEQLGIAIACLVQEEKMELVEWVRTTLMTVQGVRLSILSEAADRTLDEGDDEGSGSAAPRITMDQALQKIEDYPIPYIKEEYAQAATKDPHLKLALRLIDCHVADPEADEFEWYFPASITPEDLQKHLDVIARYLAEPLELGGKKPTELLQKKRAPRVARRRTRAAASDSSSEDSGEEAAPRKRKEKRQKEQVQYKSAEFIEDSDAELGDDEVFFRKEEEIRKRAQEVAEGGGGSLMSATGSKKRKRGKALERTSLTKEAALSARKKGKRAPRKKSTNNADEDEDERISDENTFALEAPATASPPRPQPRPRARWQGAPSTVTSSTPGSSPRTIGVAASSPIGLSDVEDTVSSSASVVQNAPADQEATNAALDLFDVDEANETVTISHRRTRRRVAVLLSDDED